jgi:putative acetyltransferase
MEIRPFLSSDQAGLVALYDRAFPDEDLMPVVTALHDGADTVLSLIAEREADVIGHILFSFARVEETPVALLAPLGVAPSLQRQGIGTALVQAGFERAAKAGVQAVYVLGDPGYYQRFGFGAERPVASPYALPTEWQDAWQSRQLGNANPTALAGPLHLPSPWLDPKLWLP